MNPDFSPVTALIAIIDPTGGRSGLRPFILLAAVGVFVILGAVIAWKVTKMLMKLALGLVILLAIAGAAWWHFARPQ